MAAHSILYRADTLPTCDIGYVRRALGRTNGSERAFLALVQALVDERGFPKPLPDYRAGALIERVTRRSSFIRHAVDTWLDNFLPPQAALALDEAARVAAAAEMDAAASNLRLVASRGRRVG
jgi:hypothetical protein